MPSRACRVRSTSAASRHPWSTAAPSRRARRRSSAASDEPSAYSMTKPRRSERTATTCGTRAARPADRKCASMRRKASTWAQVFSSGERWSCCSAVGAPSAPIAASAPHLGHRGAPARTGAGTAPHPRRRSGSGPSPERPRAATCVRLPAGPHRSSSTRLTCACTTPAIRSGSSSASGTTTLRPSVRSSYSLGLAGQLLHRPLVRFPAWATSGATRSRNSTSGAGTRRNTMWLAGGARRRDTRTGA